MIATKQPEYDEYKSEEKSIHLNNSECPLPNSSLNFHMNLSDKKFVKAMNFSNAYAEEFIFNQPSLESYWRGIILIGRNVASYKFALAKTLIELNPQSGRLLKLSELAPVFAKHISEHLRHSPKQTTSASSKFLEAVKAYSIDNPNQNKLIEETVRFGFNDVIDAFHNVGSGEIPRRFYIDERKSNNGIRITDEFSQLSQSQQFAGLSREVESRWNLVETAWELGVSSNLLKVEYDDKEEILFTFNRSNRRKNVTSSRSALNGYQRGKCFYCYKIININDGAETEVDHFFPFTLEEKDSSFKNINGVWNLVLSCSDCNAGEGGKHTKIPSVKLLTRLFKRNNYFTSSLHPLKETILKQTGNTEEQRRNFLQNYHNKAINVLMHTWEPKAHDDGDF
jgi:5-methylcytosine-specific restriction endonuclease McrA